MCKFIRPRLQGSGRAFAEDERQSSGFTRVQTYKVQPHQASESLPRNMATLTQIIPKALSSLHSSKHED
jgi:hypothetical protein